MSRQIVDAPAVLRRLARDQWVRLHGTPRVTVLAGAAIARELWQAWMGVTGGDGSVLHGEAVEVLIKRAVERAVAAPGAPIAIVAPLEDITGWRQGRNDRLAAMVDEGLVIVTEADLAATAPGPAASQSDTPLTQPSPAAADGATPAAPRPSERAELSTQDSTSPSTTSRGEVIAGT